MDGLPNKTLFAGKKFVPAKRGAESHNSGQNSRLFKAPRVRLKREDLQEVKTIQEQVRTETHGKLAIVGDQIGKGVTGQVQRLQAGVEAVDRSVLVRVNKAHEYTRGLASALAKERGTLLTSKQL